MNKTKKTFDMDGTEHKIGDLDCCGMFGRSCNFIVGDPGDRGECGGILHYQPTYDGAYYECDKCGLTK